MTFTIRERCEICGHLGAESRYQGAAVTCDFCDRLALYHVNRTWAWAAGKVANAILGLPLEVKALEREVEGLEREVAVMRRTYQAVSSHYLVRLEAMESKLEDLATLLEAGASDEE